jgi:hypothetical protein
MASSVNASASRVEGGRRPEIVEAPAEVLDEGVRRDDDPGGAVAL